MNVALCPDRERLESYALGKLAPDDLDSVAEHLLACPNCDSVVESLESVSDSLVEELRKPALEDQLELEPELRQSLEALRDGQIGGAALDVTVPEPLPVDHALLQLPNVIITPHIASASEATRAKMGEMAAENVIAVLRGEVPPNPVNRPASPR